MMRMRTCSLCGVAFDSNGLHYRCAKCMTPKKPWSGLTYLYGKSLTNREWQVVGAAAEGCFNREIADSLKLTEGTVKVYMSHIYAKTGVRNRVELTLWASSNQRPSGNDTIVE